MTKKLFLTLFFFFQMSEMALNRFMHPRNPYFNNTPDFLKLCEAYPPLKNHIKAGSKANKKASIDFRDIEALRDLCCALMKDTFSEQNL